MANEHAEALALICRELDAYPITYPDEGAMVEALAEGLDDLESEYISPRKPKMHDILVKLGARVVAAIEQYGKEQTR